MTGIIPGSMGTASYIVEGLGNPKALNSCSHGAGRVLGRNVAKQTLSLEAERERLRQAVTREAEKILELARAEIDAATRAAKLELKIYAARQAVDLAEAMIRQRLDQAGQRRLVARFVGALTPE